MRLEMCLTLLGLLEGCCVFCSLCGLAALGWRFSVKVGLMFILGPGGLNCAYGLEMEGKGNSWVSDWIG